MYAHCKNVACLHCDHLFFEKKLPHIFYIELYQLKGIFHVEDLI